MFINFRHSAFNVRTYGSGDIPMICCHGFSQDGSLFKQLTPSLGSAYRLLSLDLPHHGKTEWQEEEPLTPEGWNMLLSHLLTECGFEDQPFALAGFSMGGRWIMQAAQGLADRLESLWLFAPEGIVTNWPYHLGVHTKGGKYLMQHLIEHPGFLFNSLEVLRRTGLINRKITSFALVNMQTRELRQLVWDSWLAMSDMRPDLNQLAGEVNRNKVPSYIFFGKRDVVLPLRAGRRLHRKLENSEFHTPDMGHFVVRPEINPLITEVLNRHLEARSDG